VENCEISRWVFEMQWHEARGRPPLVRGGYVAPPSRRARRERLRDAREDGGDAYGYYRSPTPSII
jgi:hypothetical protein